MCVCTLWNSNDENSHSTGVKIGEYILPWNLTSKGGKKWWRWWYFVNVEATRGSCWYPWREASLPWRLMQSTSHSDRCRLPDQTMFFLCTSVTNFCVHVSAASVYPWSIPSSSIVSECVHEWGAAERGRIPDRSLQSKPHQQETFSQPFTCLALQLYTCTWYRVNVCVSRIISTMT